MRRLRLSDVGVLQQGMTSLATSQDLLAESVSVQSSVPDSLESVQASWKAVADPVTLTTLTVLLLSWLLLFLIVTDSVEARGSEIALAKLRGHGRGGILIVGLAEPAVVLLAALPAACSRAGQPRPDWPGPCCCRERRLTCPGPPGSLPRPRSLAGSSR